MKVSKISFLEYIFQQITKMERQIYNEIIKIAIKLCNIKFAWLLFMAFDYISFDIPFSKNNIY